MSKVLIFARDPGAANAVVPLVRPLINKGYQVMLYGKDAALSMYKRYNLECYDLTARVSDINEKTLSDLLSVLQPDAIITGTGSDDFTEKYLWAAAENRSVPTFAILDQWINYGVRFSRYPLIELAKYEAEPDHSFVPDFILVMDEEVREHLLAAGLAPEKVVVTGQPYFDMLLQRKQEIEQWLPGKKSEASLQLLWVSENITEADKGQDLKQYYWGYTERSVFIHLLNQLDSLLQKTDLKVHLIIKLHPNETLDVYSDLAAAHQTSQLSIAIDKETDPLILVLQSDLICGMSSMLLSEAVALGKPILSIQIGLNKDDPFLLARKGVVKTILSTEELGRSLIEVLVNGVYPQAALEVKPGAVDKIINLVEGCICQS